MAETTPPDPIDLLRLLGELRERLRQGAVPPDRRGAVASAAGGPAPGAPVTATPTSPAEEGLDEETLDERRLDDAEALELEAAGRRRLLEALLHGSARSRPVGHGLWWGVAVAAALALGIGLAAMVGATLARGGHGHPTSIVVVQGWGGDVHGYTGDQAT